MTLTPDDTEAGVTPEGSAEVRGEPDATVEPGPAADPAILAATNLALSALREITDIETIGAYAGHETESETVATLFYECLLPGYPGWRWAASLTKVSADDPVTVLEVELLPGDEALVAPEWVPWAERLAAYREAQAQQAEEEALAATLAAAEVEGDDDDDDDDVMENDYSDFDDFDGVDIDALGDELAGDDDDDGADFDDRGDDLDRDDFDGGDDDRGDDDVDPSEEE